VGIYRGVKSVLWPKVWLTVGPLVRPGSQLGWPDDQVSWPH
jgi:hypothetical protein